MIWSGLIWGNTWIGKGTELYFIFLVSEML